MQLGRVGAVGVGHMTRQEFARGMHRHVALSRGSLHGALLQGTGTGYCHRTPITGYRHRVLPLDTITGGTVTEYSHRAPVTGSTATNLGQGENPVYRITKKYVSLNR